MRGFFSCSPVFTPGRGADAFSYLRSMPEFSPQIVVTDFLSEAGTSSTCPGLMLRHPQSTTRRCDLWNEPTEG
jgi:hypothetical protein